MPLQSHDLIIPTSNRKLIDLVVIGGYDNCALIKQEVLLSSAELMKYLKKNGWVLERIRGSHHIFVKEGVDHHITLPHPRKDLAKGTLQEILKSM